MLKQHHHRQPARRLPELSHSPPPQPSSCTHTIVAVSTQGSIREANKIHARISRQTLELRRMLLNFLKSNPNPFKLSSRSLSVGIGYISEQTVRLHTCRTRVLQSQCSAVLVTTTLHSPAASPFAPTASLVPARRHRGFQY
jgi:hypothetical protein